MSTYEHTPHLPGCDDSQAYLVDLWEPINDFLVTHFNASTTWFDTLSSDTRHTLQQQFEQLEDAITQLRAPHLTDRRLGRQRWQMDYLLPVAKRLHLTQKAWKSTLRLCWIHGLFDYAVPKQRKVCRPTLDDIVDKVGTILEHKDTSKRQVAILVDAGLCRDELSAWKVVKKLSLVEKQAASEARAMILASIKFGLAGLLRFSNHPCAEELCLLQGYTDSIMRLSEQPAKTLATLRADITALFHVLQTIESALKLWKQNLMYEPQGSALRERYQQSISPALQTRIIVALAVRRECSATEADDLFHTFVSSGVAGLIGWRCAADKDTLPRALTIQRIEDTVAQHLGALTLEGQQEIVSLLVHLYDASIETNVPLPIISLLNEHPSSRYRVRLGRRLSFGYPAMLRQRRRPYRPGRKRSLSKQWRPKPNQPREGVSPEDQLIAVFTQRAGLSTQDKNKEGRTRLRYLLTYGGIGMLPKEDWLKLIDVRLISYLYFFKLGKLDGALDWNAMFKRLQSYAAILEIPALSLQLTRALFNSLSKPPHWHGGFGEAVALVRQRATLILNAPRLHETWVVLPIKPRLRLQVVDDAGRLISDYCSVVVVFDKASQRPVGCWSDAETVDVGLALYQSIWHPGALYWPLRGTPNLIQAPQSLVKSRRNDLERAADWMLANVELITSVEKSRMLDAMPYADTLLQRMSLDLPYYVREKYGASAMTAQQVSEAVLTWLISQEKELKAGDSFPNHRSSLIPPECSDSGMLLPALDCPAAAWLLPVVAQVVAGRDKVRYRGLAYTAPGFRVEPGTTFKVRAFPYRYERMPFHIFVEAESGAMYYLEARP